MVERRLRLRGAAAFGAGLAVGLLVTLAPPRGAAAEVPAARAPDVARR